MDCYSFKRKRMDERDLIMVPETGFSLHQGWLMGPPKINTCFTSGEFMEVSKQFPISQYQSRATQFVSPQTRAMTPLDRGATNGMDGLLSDAQIHQFISSTVLPHHRTLTRMGSERVTRPLTPQTYTPGVKEGLLGTGFVGTPTSSQTYMEFEPPGKRFRPSSDQTLSQNTRTTPTLDRVALLSQANRFLSDEQISQFITSTVLPHQHKSSGTQSSASKHTETPTHTPKQTTGSACSLKELNSLAVIQVSPQSNNVSQTDTVTQTEVKHVPKGTTSPQQSLVPHRNIVPQGTNVPETKTLKDSNPRRGQNACVLQETNEATVSQQNHTTFGPCNKGLMDPQLVCEISVQSATKSEGSAVYMQKDEVTNTGSQSVPETPVQSVTTNEKLVPSQKKAHTPQPNKGYKKMYEEPKGQRRRKFSRKCKRKGKNCQQGKPQQKARETAVESPSSGSQSDGETESEENDSLVEDEDDDVSHMTPDELFEDFMEKIKSAVKDSDTTRDHYRDLYMFPWISPHQSLFDAGILIPCENFYLDLNLLQ